MESDQEVCGSQFQPARSTKWFLATAAPILALQFMVIGLCWLFIQRRRTKRLLEQGGLPTVLWKPRFIKYRPFEDDQKLSSSTITRVLPRMERLGGPYGMYGTVYGLNTAVIHIAHPVPARAIFGGASGPSNNSSTFENATSSALGQCRPRTSIVHSTGASKAPAYDHFKNFCGEGVFTADGEDWKAKRASVMHCLIRGTNSPTSDIAKRLEQEANHAADAFIAQVQQQEHNNADRCVVLNVVPLLQRSTVGLIYRYITHHDPSWAIDPHNVDEAKMETSSLSSDDSSTHSASQEEQNQCDDEHKGLLEQYLKSIIRIRMIVLAQSRSIWFFLPRWCYSWFSSLHQDEEATLVPIRKFAEQACESAQPGSPLGQLQRMQSHQSKSTSGLQSPISKDLLDEAITLLFAGQDTSAATLSWTIHLLSIYPDIQSRLAKELNSVILEDGKQHHRKITITRQIISKLPYLDAVVKEAMRLYPVAPFVVRRVQDEICLKDPRQNKESNGNISLPTGSIACIWIYGLHRNPTLWHRPNDFIPDRWLDEKSRDVGQTNGAYMPFAAGPRNCVGQPIAQVVLRTLLARLLLQFEFLDERLDGTKRPDDLRIEMEAGFTVLPKDGVRVAIRPRGRSFQ